MAGLNCELDEIQNLRGAGGGEGERGLWAFLWGYLGKAN